MSAIRQTCSPETTISGGRQTGLDRSLSISFKTVYSLEDTGDEEPIRSQKSDIPLRVLIPKRVDPAAKYSEDESQATGSEVSPQSTLVDSTAPPPTPSSPTSTYKTCFSSMPVEAPAQESTESPATSPVAWLPVKDPIALLGLTRYLGLQGMNGGKLVGLEPKVIHRIFEFLDPCTATCLGLTCRKLHNFFKYKYPNKISLWEYCPSHLQQVTITLGDLLAQWMGPRYRRHIWTSKSIPKEYIFRLPQYFTRDVYGAASGGAEIALAKRYLDYYSSQRQTAEGPIYILPYPFNKGEDWYAEAIDCIKKDARDFHHRPLWHWNTWMSFWIPFDVFSRMSYMDKLRALQWFEYVEWAESMEIPGIAGLLRTPMVAEKLWWPMKRYLRWISWWVGGLPAREPFPAPGSGQRKQNPRPVNSLLISRSYT